MLSTNRRFALSLCIGMSVATAFTFWRGHITASIIIASLAALHVLAALFAPRLLTPSRLFLEGLVNTIGRFVSIVTMTLFFALIFTPFSLLWRLIGKDSLKKTDPVWLDITAHENDSEGLKRLF